MITSKPQETNLYWEELFLLGTCKHNNLFLDHLFRDQWYDLQYLNRNFFLFIFSIFIKICLVRNEQCHNKREHGPTCKLHILILYYFLRYPSLDIYIGLIYILICISNAHHKYVKSSNIWHNIFLVFLISICYNHATLATGHSSTTTTCDSLSVMLTMLNHFSLFLEQVDILACCKSYPIIPPFCYTFK